MRITIIMLEHCLEILDSGSSSFQSKSKEAKHNLWKQHFFKCDPILEKVVTLWWHPLKMAIFDMFW